MRTLPFVVLLLTLFGCGLATTTDPEPLSLGQVDIETAERALLSYFQSVVAHSEAIERVDEGRLFTTGDGKYVFVGRAITDSGFICGIGVSFTSTQGDQIALVNDGVNEYYMYDPIHFRCHGPCNCEMQWDLNTHTVTCNCADGANDCTLSICTGDCSGNGPWEGEDLG